METIFPKIEIEISGNQCGKLYWGTYKIITPSAPIIAASHTAMFSSGV